MRSIAIVLLMTCAAGAPALAQQTRPTAAAAAAATTRPADPPATRPADASTPKDALRMLNLAMRDGDAPTVRTLFVTRTPDEAKLVAAMAEYAAALAALHRTAEHAYGAAGANAVTGDTAADSAEGLAAIDHAEVKLDGDAATVTYKTTADPPVHLTRVNGQWRLPLSQLTADANPAAEQHRLEELTSQTRLARQMAEEISQGKFKTADDAAHAWQGRLLDAVLAGAVQHRGE